MRAPDTCHLTPQPYLAVASFVAVPTAVRACGSPRPATGRTPCRTSSSGSSSSGLDGRPVRVHAVRVTGCLVAGEVVDRQTAVGDLGRAVVGPCRPSSHSRRRARFRCCRRSWQRRSARSRPPGRQRPRRQEPPLGRQSERPWERPWPPGSRSHHCCTRPQQRSGSRRWRLAGSSGLPRVRLAGVVWRRARAGPLT
jgi:hypothetical protein